jgi:hypothetical protein
VVLDETWPSLRAHSSPRDPVIARLFRPKSVAAFEIEACGRPGFVLRMEIAGVALPVIVFDGPGCVTKSFPMPPGPSSLTDISLYFDYPNRVMRVGSFGFK